jgi:hypothetical protein
MNQNAFILVFWIISHLLFDPEHMEEVLDETKPAFHGKKHSGPDLDYLFDTNYAGRHYIWRKEAS